MIALTCALLVVYMWWAPQSAIARAVRGMIDHQVRRLSAVRPTTVALFVLMVALLGALVAYGKIDGLIMALPAASEGLALFATLDVGLAVEVMTAAWLVACRGGLRSTIRNLSTAIPLWRWMTGRRRPSRLRRRRRMQPDAANDDEPAGDEQTAFAPAA